MPSTPLTTKLAREAADQIPLVKPIRVSLEHLLEARRDAIGKALLEQIAHVLSEKGDKDPAEVIRECIDQSEGAAAVERGYQTVMETADPKGRLCIAAMVAEYLHRRRSPDRTYRRAGGLFSDIDGDELPELLQFSEGVLQLANEVKGPHRLIVETSYHEPREVRIWTSVGDAPEIDLRYPATAGFASMLELLFLHGIVRRRDPQAVGNPSGNWHAEVSPGESVDALEIIRDCIVAAIGDTGTLGNP
jgi:hypothetical protein